VITLDRRIDVHYHVATENNPLYELSGPRIWWSEDEALKMMDNNDVSVAMLSHTVQTISLIAQQDRRIFVMVIFPSLSWPAVHRASASPDLLNLP